MTDGGNDNSATPVRRKRRGRFWLWLLLSPVLLVVIPLASLWAFGAIYFDGPAGPGNSSKVLAIAWAVTTLVLVIRGWGGGRRLTVWLACFAVVLVPWLLIPASNDRDWKAEWAKTPWAEIDGDTITFHNFRNFDYGHDGSVTERWETRTVRLSNLRGVDYFHDAFGGNNWAHPMLSYDFGPDGHILVSIETRREADESFSQLGGLYKMFELQYLFGDERDFIRVRTNIREEPVYLYRMDFPMTKVRDLFLDSVRTLNDLKKRPRWYNVITNNCTTSYWAQTPTERRSPLDIRVLINGELDQLMYERGSFLMDDLPFAELREKAFINEAAQAAHEDPEFSKRIREGRLGF
jgi:hypothetical protein